MQARTEALEALQQSTAVVLAAFAGIDGDAIGRRPAPGAWSAWEIAYHLVDIERWYAAKLCEAVTPERSAALARFMALWADLRAATLDLARAIPAEHLDRPGLLSGVPEWTPRALLHAIAAHDVEHATQVRVSTGRSDGG